MSAKNLAQLAAAPGSILSDLAALKIPDKDDEKRGSPSTRPPAKSSATANGSGDPGRWMVERYLADHNVDVSVKVDGQGTLYRLAECYFDPNHKNESSINQLHNGKILYQCFHQSCDHTWAEVREIISGDKKFPEYYENYDPKKFEKKKYKKKTTKDAASPWLSYSERTGSIKVNTAELADHIKEQYEPIMYDEVEQKFYRYDDRKGVWIFMSDGLIKRDVRHILDKLSTPHHIDSTLVNLKTDVLITQDECLSNAFLLNLKNGMFDLHKMELVPHAPEYYSRVQMEVNYDEEAECPTLIEALSRIFCDELAKIDVLQQFFGYCLYPQIIFPCALFQIGGGGNGKGVIESVLIEMLGQKNVSHISMDRMQKPFGPVEIKDKLLNSCGETESAPLDVTHFKAIANGDSFQAEVKYRGDVSFRAIAKHMISMNSFPGIKEKTKAFFRRILVLEYNQTFEGKDRDVKLTDKILEEIDGVFMWALEGLKIVLEEEEILVPDSVERAKERFRESTSPILTFIREQCVVAESAFAPRVDFWERYKQWFEDSDAKKKYQLSKKGFYEHMKLNIPLQDKRIGSKDCWSGAGLVDAEQHLEPECSIPKQTTL